MEMFLLHVFTDGTFFLNGIYRGVFNLVIYRVPVNLQGVGNPEKHKDSDHT